MPPIKQILAAVGRLYLLRRPRGEYLRGRDAAIAILGAAALMAFALFDRFVPQSEAQFFPDGFLTLGTYVLAGIVATWLLSRCSRPRVAFADALLLTVGICPVAIAVYALIQYYVPGSWNLAATLGLAIYAITYFRISMKALTGTPQSPAVLALAIALVGFAALSNLLGWSPSLWSTPSDGDSAYTATQERAEELLFDQPALIDAVLARVPTAAGSKPQMHFLGFAGVGEEKVFADEIALAEHRIDDRYGLDKRVVLLTNDQRDLDTAPLATVSGLRRALQGVGEKMDRGRDVVFIALSSHGSQEPDLSVSNGSLPLLQLTPTDVKEAIDAAGIRWKVIVISSCYAGAFIDALRDDQTIVIAAAAADRTSFGCSNDRSLTYFGEAFYRDALPAATSLRGAFDAAKSAIEKREIAEKIEASHPTAFFGAAMELKLTQMERQR